MLYLREVFVVIFHKVTSCDGTDSRNIVLLIADPVSSCILLVVIKKHADILVLHECFFPGFGLRYRNTLLLGRFIQTFIYISPNALLSLSALLKLDLQTAYLS